jgi:hypothetical protein
MLLVILKLSNQKPGFLPDFHKILTDNLRQRAEDSLDEEGM